MARSLRTAWCRSGGDGWPSTGRPLDGDRGGSSLLSVAVWACTAAEFQGQEHASYTMASPCRHFPTVPSRAIALRNGDFIRAGREAPGHELAVG